MQLVEEIIVAIQRITLTPHPRVLVYQLLMGVTSEHHSPGYPFQLSFLAEGDDMGDNMDGDLFHCN